MAPYANPRHPLRVSTEHSHPASNALLAVASVVVIVAGLKAASSLFVPFLLAGFISLLCAPVLFWLRDRGLPNAIALIVVLLGLLGIGAVFGGLMSTSINEFTRLLPSYQERFGSVVVSLTSALGEYGIDFGSNPDEANPFDPQAALGIAGGLAGNLGSLLNNAFLIFLAICFILLEASSIPRKVREAFGDSPELEGRMTEIGESIRR